jgi:hypothetical protein
MTGFGGQVQGKGDRLCFAPGEKIPQSGVSRIFDGGHRVSHDVILLRDELFPRCARCEIEVKFRLIQAAPHIEDDSSLGNRKLFELPHPNENDAA